MALSLLLAVSALAATTDNDDSCDIGLAPAATLLLPYFEVDVDDFLGENTLFTITNTGQRAQVARVTLWTDYAYPVLTFDVYLTGYDVQGINLFDVLARGIIGGEHGTGVAVSPLGERSKKNPLLDTSNCGALPHRIDAALVTQLQDAFRQGVAPDCNDVGNEHENAVGYATIDVVGNCAPGRGPTDPRYFSEDIRYENVLIGDYVSLRAGANRAGATPMVHIRALPGGGTPSTRIPGPLPRLERTFYGRFQDPADPHLDARQALPSTFGMRWINAGPGSFRTSLRIWREGVPGPAAACAERHWNGKMIVAETVAFDEHENGEGFSKSEFLGTTLGPVYTRLPATSLVATSDNDVFGPAILSESPNGWLYLNLDDLDDDDGFGAHQNWVTVTMEAEGRFSATFDAAWLGNGCSPVIPVSEFADPGSTSMPGPADDVNP